MKLKGFLIFIFSMILFTTTVFAVEIPILCYHDVVKSGANSSLLVTEEKFRNDLLYLKEKGYTTILPREWIDAKNGIKPLPEKPIMITFDDGYVRNYDIVYPILTETNNKAVIALIVKMINQNPNFMTWDQVFEMNRSGLVEFGSHTYNLHNPERGGLYPNKPGFANGISMRVHENRVKYIARVLPDIQKSVEIIKNEIGTDVNYFAFPYGHSSSFADEILTKCNIPMSTTMKYGFANSEKSLRSLPRITVIMTTDLSKVLK